MGTGILKEKIIELFYKKKTNVEIAKELETNEPTVSRALSMHLKQKQDMAGINRLSEIRKMETRLFNAIEEEKRTGGINPNIGHLAREYSIIKL